MVALGWRSSEGPDDDGGDAVRADGEEEGDAVVVVDAEGFACGEEPQLEAMAMRDEVERDELEDDGPIGVPGVRGVVLGEADEGAGGGAVDVGDVRHAEEPGARRALRGIQAQGWPDSMISPSRA